MYLVGGMSKQIHIRLDNAVYEALSEYSVENNASMQDSISTAVIQFINRQKPILNQENASFTFIDLFAGIGGMRLAFESAGVSKKNSLGRETGFQDKTQGTLFFDVCRILKAKRPKAFLLENVKNLKSHDKGRTFKIIMESLNELKYDVYTAILDGQNYVPQHRERILIVGFDKERYGESLPFSFDINPKNPKPLMKDILEKSADDKYTLSDKLWLYLQNYAAKHKAAGNGFGYGIAERNGISRTLSARYYKDGSEILIEQKGKNPRRLTPRECARLQGFSDDFKIVVSDTQAYKQFGNSVVVPLMADVAKLIVNRIRELDYES